MAVTALALSSAACGTHLLTGLLLVTDVFTTDTSGGRVAASSLLIVSCLVVLAICICACNLPQAEALLKGNRPEGAEEEADLEAGNQEVEGKRAIQRSLESTPEQESTARPRPEALDLPADPAAARELDPAGLAGEQKDTPLEAQTPPPLDAQTPPPLGAEKPSEVATRFEAMLAERGLAVVVGAEDSVEEGLRQLLEYHLRKTGVHALTEAQAYLLEHHLPRLSTYSEKIVHTISFAQKVLATAKDLPVASGPQEEPAATEKSPPSPEKPAATEERRKKILKLKDMEILQLYSDAIKEAEIEADWRGIDTWPAQGTCNAISPDAGGHGEERKVWREGLELLGQAFAFRERSNVPNEEVSESGNLRAASGELLEQQLRPVNNRSLPADCTRLSVTAAPSAPPKAKVPELQCCRLEQVVAEDASAPLALAPPVSSAAPGRARLPPVLEEKQIASARNDGSP